MATRPSSEQGEGVQLLARRFFWTWVCVAVLTALLLAGCDLVGRKESTPTPTAQAPTPTATPTPGSPPASLAALPSIAELVERMEPAVVSIQVETTQRGVFGTARRTASGSGVIFREDGHILTNNHVVENATQILVILHDGQERTARLVGTDRITDLAVIKIEEKGLPAAPLGDVAKVRVGDWVVAIGNALGLEGGPSVTVGVVSGLGRSLPTQPDVTLFDLIQTDAAINPGNSGGPLINLQGEVIGINTAVLRDGEAQGIGFAISTETAIPVAEQLVLNGRVVWPWLGISGADVNRATAVEQNLSVREGVLIARVVANSPAERAGIKTGDVILALDGQPTPNLRALQRLLRTQFKVGQQVTANLVRADKRNEVTLTLGEFPR